MADGRMNKCLEICKWQKSRKMEKRANTFKNELAATYVTAKCPVVTAKSFLKNLAFRILRLK